MGKGDRPRNVGPKFKANFLGITWGVNNDSAAWYSRKSTKRVYHYNAQSTPKIEHSPSETNQN
jgi:hypothetical protein